MDGATVSVDLLADLNEPQRQAVMHREGPLLVLAGAGSGKTRVITRRIAYLIAQGVDPRAVLAITFTNKAAGEMRQRVESLDTRPGATISTFHALCARLLREFGHLSGLSSNYTIYDQADQLRLVKESMERVGLTERNIGSTRALNLISNAKNDLKDPGQFLAAAQEPLDQSAAQAYAQYQKLLADRNAVDFDDQLMRMALMLRDHPPVRQALGQRYKYVLIDEYQDTNHAQYLIAHGIALDHRNICATGDPDQSIYAWRGADVGNILDFENDYPGATVIRLEENYRSTAPILQTASSLIANNKMRKEKTLWTRRQGGADVTVLICDDERAEAREVARRVRRVVDEGGNLDSVAVFYRTNALSRVLEDALVSQAIPYRIARGVEFYNRKEIKDVLAYLRVLINPADDLSCQRIINVPTRGIGAVSVNRLMSQAATRGLSLLAMCAQADQAGLSGPAAVKAKAFAAMISGLAGTTEQPVRATMESLLAVTGMGVALAAEDDEENQPSANVAELISSAAEFDTTAQGSLADFLHQISLVSDVDRFEGGQGVMTLMTLHAAKGLEFPRVFIIGWEQGLLPLQRQTNGWGGDLQPLPQRELEEERRLAFVGMTRAQEELTISCARLRTIRGKPTPTAPSPFLAEIGTEGVHLEDQSTYAPQQRRFGRGGFYEDASQREQIEAMETSRLERSSPEGRTYERVEDDQEQVPLPEEYERLRVGCRVRHPMFGTGRIVSLSQPWPQTRSVVDFDTCGRKTLVLRLAKLELL